MELVSYVTSKLINFVEFFICFYFFLPHHLMEKSVQLMSLGLFVCFFSPCCLFIEQDTGKGTNSLT
jgi:hypothetical protein